MKKYYDAFTEEYYETKYKAFAGTLHYKGKMISVHFWGTKENIKAKKHMKVSCITVDKEKIKRTA